MKFIFHRKNAEINPSSDSFYERCLYPKKYSKEQILAYTKKIDKKFTITTLNNWFVNFRSRCTKDSDSEKFQDWFGKLLQTKGQDILRSKGILDFEGQNERFVFQGVHMLMDGSPMGKWPENQPRNSRIVFIGRDINNMGLKEGFESCKIA